VSDNPYNSGLTTDMQKESRKKATLGAFGCEYFSFAI
jgi:hypothetical protein